MKQRYLFDDAYLFHFTRRMKTVVSMVMRSAERVVKLWKEDFLKTMKQMNV